MSLDIIALGTVPAGEAPAVASESDYVGRAFWQCRRFIYLLRHTVGAEPEGAKLRVRRTGPDFDPYLEVVVEITARAFAHIVPTLEPALAGSSVDGIVAALMTHPPSAKIALVGHEPLLGALLARLLGAAQGERLAFEKGGAALVDLPDGPAADGRLRWFLKPRILRTLAGPT